MKKKIKNVNIILLLIFYKGLFYYKFYENVDDLEMMLLYL